MRRLFFEFLVEELEEFFLKICNHRILDNNRIFFAEVYKSYLISIDSHRDILIELIEFSGDDDNISFEAFLLRGCSLARADNHALQSLFITSFPVILREVGIGLSYIILRTDTIKH